MVRVSLDRRIGRIWDEVCPPGSMLRREHQLSPEQAALLAKHRRQVAREISRFEKIAPGASYEALLAGTLDVPQMPRAVRTALGLVDPPVVTEEHTVVEAAQSWTDYAQGTGQ